MLLDTKPKAPAIGWPLLPFPNEDGALDTRPRSPKASGSSCR